MDKGSSDQGSEAYLINPLLVLYHEDFSGHLTSQAILGEVPHQESAARTEDILSCLVRLQEEIPHCIDIQSSDEAVPLATYEQLTAAHDKDYVDFLELLEREEGGRNQPVCFTPRVVDKLFSGNVKNDYFDKGKDKLSGTRFSSGTYQAAKRASGCVIRALEIVLDSQQAIASRVFCLVRPPGHHAGRRGFDAEVGGCGFCVVNHVAVGVASILQRDPERRIAVVDIDVHHGNGTQDIFLTRFGGFNTLYCSTHLYEKFPGDGDMDFFPGTGHDEDTDNVLNVPLVPLWTAELEEKRNRKRTRSGKAKRSKAQRGKHNPHTNASLSKDRVKSNGSGRVAFRQAIEDRIVPKLKQFRADVIIMSSGFDAAFGDCGNTMPEGIGIDLNADDFEWVTSAIVAGSGCQRIVSVLEGGYGKWCEEKNSFDTTSLVDCCAAHIKALTWSNG